jgi:hypothetical protein
VDRWNGLGMLELANPGKSQKNVRIPFPISILAIFQGNISENKKKIFNRLNLS